MSEQLPDRNAAANPEMPDQGPEASSRQEVDGVGAERSGLERSDRPRSVAQTPSTTPAPREASPLLDRAGQRAIADGAEQDNPDFPEPDAPEARNGGLDLPLPALVGQRRGGRRLVKSVAKPEVTSPEQRLLLLDTWTRS